MNRLNALSAALSVAISGVCLSLAVLPAAAQQPPATTPPAPSAEPATTQPAKDPAKPATAEPPKDDAAPKPEPVKVIDAKQPVLDPKDAPVDPRFRYPMDNVRRLAGTWESGDSDKDGMPDFRMYARNTAGYSAVTEVMFIDTEYENLSVYTSEGTDIVLTFVSCLNNVARLRAHTRGPDVKKNELNFVLEPLTNGSHLNVASTGRYLKDLKIKFVDDDTVQYTVQFVVNGADQAPGTVEFKRVVTPAAGQAPLPGGKPTPPPAKSDVDASKAPVAPPK